MIKSIYTLLKMTFIFFVMLHGPFQGVLFSYEQIVIQKISNSGQEFITRSGTLDGRILGQKVTFTKDNVSMIAKLKSVNKGLSHWRLENEAAQIPFEEGEIVTMYDTTEYLWALQPQKSMEKYVYSKVFRPTSSLAFHTSLMRGLSASSSGTSIVNEQRGGVNFEFFSEHEIVKHFGLAWGPRFSQELINVPAATLTNNKSILILEGRYYFDRMETFYGGRFALSFGFGYGESLTRSPGLSSSGQAILLPSMRILLNMPFDKEWEMIFELAGESIRSEEIVEDAGRVSTDQNNVRWGLGLRYFL